MTEGTEIDAVAYPGLEQNNGALEQESIPSKWNHFSLLDLIPIQSEDIGVQNTKKLLIV